MGRQADKSHKKSVGETKEKQTTEAKVKPLNGEKKVSVEDKTVVKSCSVFSCGNVLMVIFTVVVALIVTAVISKATELQHLNVELDQTIGKMKLEYEVLNQKMGNSISESEMKTVSDQALIKLLESEADSLTKKLGNTILESKETTVSDGKIIKSLESEKNTLMSKLNDLDLKLTNADQMLMEFKGTGDKLLEDNKEKEDKIMFLNEEMNGKVDAFTNEKKDLTDKLKNTEQDKLIVEQNCDMTVRNINIEREAQMKEHDLLMSKKEAEISTIAKENESMQGLIQKLSDENIVISNEVESVNIKNLQISEELETKSATINSVKEQNTKLSNDFSLHRDETIQIIENLAEEKKTCLKESEINGKTYAEELNKKEETVDGLKGELRDLEKTNAEEIDTLEREFNKEVKFLEESKETLMENFRNEKLEKNNLLNEKLSLEGSVKDLQASGEKISNNFRKSAKDLETCQKEKTVLNDHNNEKQDKINSLAKEKVEIESKCKTISDNLSKLASEKEELIMKINGKKKTESKTNVN